MYKKLIAMTLVLAACSCSKSEDADPEVESTRAEVIASVGTQVILPTIQVFASESQKLNTLAESVATDRLEQANLEELQQNWLQLATAWKKVSLYSMGPIDDDFLESGIYYTSVNTSGIESYIAKSTPVDAALIGSLGAAYKGIPAIEYLLFGNNESVEVQLEKYQGATASQRIQYLKALCADLKIKAADLESKWNSSGGNYIKTFTDASGRDINSSLGKLSNKMINMIYTIKDERIGAPNGTRNNGTPQPALVDAPYSDESLALLKAEIEGIQGAFTGDLAGGTSGLGLDDLLNQVGAQSETGLLSTKINSQFDAVYTKIDMIQVPLSRAVTEQSQLVTDLYTEVKKLQVLLEVDMINNLGVLLTFSDNDGD
ncbi:putative lipoprotein [Dyadobacter jejuensis]|uniref:Putative lipoprotein n=1 Tax=Dyadobacter jejuensis TaxID=1082580 RepID=A0A316AK23_9BACT|nr:imelysin family protein [Dyadobacter jejuensis]PWJ58006.1 putative lipoprotein [Dyadobacter jejuensis]